jgi:uncharacterized protein with HEPN domain
LPFKDPSLPLSDIQDAIARIDDFTAGMDFEDFRQDPKTVAAVERKLQLISEAAIRLGEEAERLCPGPQWRNIRGLGNWLRHQYDRIDLETIWRTVRSDLPSLRRAVESAISRPPESPGGGGPGGVI